MIIGLQFESWGGIGWAIDERGDGFHVSTKNGKWVCQTWEGAVNRVRQSI